MMNFKLLHSYLSHDLRFENWLDRDAAYEFCEQLNLIAKAAHIEDHYGVRTSLDGRSWTILKVTG